jgi:hypothetical protein
MRKIGKLAMTTPTSSDPWEAAFIVRYGRAPIPGYETCGREHDTDEDIENCLDEPCGAGEDPYGRTAEDWAHHAE